MKLLLHSCCGPCSTYPVEQLRQQGHDISAYFYNPNIHPYREFKHRLDTFVDYAEKVSLPIIVDQRYLLEDYLTAVMPDWGNRCATCYQMRFLVVAKEARQRGFDAFTTTLLVSPYQQHELIRRIGEQTAAAVGIEFYYQDFRPGFRRGQDMAIELGLYRQPYCGCIFSEKDRYYKPKRKESST